MCARVVYLLLVGEPPDPGSHFSRKDEEQEEEELHGTDEGVRRRDDAAASWLTLAALTNPSMHGDSFMAPQQPRKPTTIMRAPAAIRMYTP